MTATPITDLDAAVAPYPRDAVVRAPPTAQLSRRAFTAGSQRAPLAWSP